MAWTLEQRTTLAAAIASGLKNVDYGDRRVQYQNTGEMLAALAQIDAYLASLEGVFGIRRSLSTFRRP